MIKIFAQLLLVFTFSTSTVVFSQITKSALFIGNSYTYSNDLPLLISNLASADGNTFINDQNTPGGYTLEGHSSNATTLTKIATGSFDFVILQDQSQRPSFPWTQVQEEVFPYAEILCDSVRSANACSIPVFFNTWGRRDGDDQWDSINTFAKMNHRLHVAYNYMANQNSGMLSPVGAGFSHVFNDGVGPVSHNDLYVADGSHPSIYGSYLSACVFYELLFETAVVGNTFLPGAISSEKGIYLQEIAHHVLTEVDSISTHYIQPEAAYSVEYDGLTANFTNLSSHAFEYSWDFGDGTTSTEVNPSHEYTSDPTNFTVSLTATYCDRSDLTSSATIGLKEELESASYFIYPNPSTGKINITNANNERVHIFNMTGKLVFETVLKSPKLNLDLKPGIYLIEINHSVQRLVIH